MKKLELIFNGSQGAKGLPSSPPPSSTPSSGAGSPSTNPPSTK